MGEAGGWVRKCIGRKLAINIRGVVGGAVVIG